VVDVLIMTSMSRCDSKLVLVLAVVMLKIMS